eukprot:1377220-Pyramimonas_sp.AAC.1
MCIRDRSVSSRALRCSGCFLIHLGRPEDGMFLISGLGFCQSWSSGAAPETDIRASGARARAAQAQGLRALIDATLH